MRRLPKGNAATIRVMYPDGCRHQWVLLKDAPEAKSATKFAAWLVRVAEEIDDTATRDGACAAREEKHSDV